MGSLTKEIAAILFTHDPMIINFGENIGEYNFEAEEIVSLLKEDSDNEIIIAHNGQVELLGFGRNQSVFIFDSTTKEEFQNLLDLYFDFKVDKFHKYNSRI